MLNKIGHFSAAKMVAAMAATISLSSCDLVPTGSVEEIISKHVDAVGGLEQLRAISSTKTDSNVLSDDSNEPVRVVVYAKRPNKLRKEYSFPNALVIQAYDGRIGWSQAIPRNGQRQPAVALSGEKLEHLVTEVHEVFADDLYCHMDQGDSVKLVGIGEIRDHKAFILRVVLKMGGEQIRYVDAHSFEEIRIERKEPASNAKEWTDFDDFRRVDGLEVPFWIAGFREGKKVIETRIVDFRCNVPTDDSLFSLPL